MDNQLTSDKTYEKFTWTIKNFSKLKTKKLYSENFVIGGHPWRILIFPKGNNTSYLSIYLDAGGDLSNLPNDWSRVEKFKLSLINQVNGKMTITKEYEHQFNARESDWGSTMFITLVELYDPSNGFIVNDTCIFEAEIAVTKPKHVNQLADQVVNTPKVGLNS
ncbi:ubiquitin C-terminal hydrolase 12-like isoform X1 [Lotus japonicus]|uniref:ubiquitin C-terminal hydrolase 12-like isoform X1 n=1 Tax=Lotus japonicus TaxID=34305 RepID=UPI002588638A|nr:ubiquitin C-terminal hydrolase 12-like isoform X1 [Lotus japonicus]